MKKKKKQKIKNKKTSPASNTENWKRDTERGIHGGSREEDDNEARNGV